MQQISVSCSQCGKRLKAPASLAGKRAKCSRCGTIMTIPAAPAAQDTGYELEIIEETPAPRPSANAAPQKMQAAADSPRPAASPNKPPSNVAPLLMDDLIEPELPLSALVEHVSPTAPARGNRKGGRSKATIDPGNPPPPRPDQDAGSAWDRIAARNARARGDDGPKPWFSLLGVDFTPVKTIVLLVFLSIIGGILGWWFTGPGRGLHLVEAYPVARLEALGHLSRIKNPGFAGAAKQGHSVTSTALNPLQGDNFTDELYNIGGSDKLIFTRPDSNGDYIFVHVKISERIAREEKLENRYDLAFGSGNFIMHVGQQQITPILMVAPFQTSTIEFPISSSKAIVHDAMIPLQPPPDEIRNPNQGSSGGLASGTLVYNGSNGVSGSVDFSSPYLQSGHPGVSGLYGNGELTQQDPVTGTALKYAYDGSNMTVTWNTPGKAWWSSDINMQPAAISPFAKFDIYLLYPRPQTSEPMVIKVNDRIVATLPASMAGQPGQKPSTVKVASVPSATRATGAPPVSTTGTQAMLNDDDDEDEAPKPAPAPPAAKPTGDPSVFDYFTALARAREMGQGVVSENNMKQLGLGVLTYAQQNNGNLPQTMDDLRTVLGDINALLVNNRTGANPGFMYFPPGKNINTIANPAGTPILYEIKDGKLDRHGSIMYLDGRIEHARK